MNDLCHTPGRGETIIRLADVRAGYESRRPVLRDVSLTLCRGDFMAITGPNGGGKTTLLRTLLRLLPPLRGKVSYYDAQGQPVKRLHIGYLPQKSGIDTRFPVLAEDVIRMGLYQGFRQRLTPAQQERLEEMIAIVGAESFRRHPIGSLSGGQLQRTLLGRALVSRPELLVLDEPLSYVDKEFERQIYSLVREAAEHATIVLVSHEMSVISAMANRHIIVDHSVKTCTHARHSYSPGCEE